MLLLGEGRRRLKAIANVLSLQPGPGAGREPAGGRGAA